MNLDIKAQFVLSGVKQWQVVQALGVGESTLTRMLRRKLTDEEKTRILAAVASVEGRARAKDEGYANESHTA